MRPTSLVRELHDLTAGTPLAEGAEVACHNDLDPRNTIYRATGDRVIPVAFIDWDLAAPGARIHDLAHVCWTYTGIRDDMPADAVKTQIRTIVDGYGWDGNMREIVESMLWWQDRCWRGILEEAQAGDPASKRMINGGILAAVQHDYEWTNQNLLTL